MKLIEVELSAMGLAKRRGIISGLESVLKKDWEDFDNIKGRIESEKAQLSSWDEEIEELQKRHDADLSL